MAAGWQSGPARAVLARLAGFWVPVLPGACRIFQIFQMPIKKGQGKRAGEIRLFRGY